MGLISVAWSFLKGNNLAAICVAAGLLFGYHTIVVKVKESQIERLETDNTVLKANQATITEANETLNNSIKRIQAEQEILAKNVKEFQNKDAEIKEWFELQRIRLANDEEAVRSFVKDDPKGFIEKANQEIKCVIQNFGRNNCFFSLSERTTK